jgi:hypothetical protein
MTHIHPQAVAALELTGQLTAEATSPRDIAYDAPLHHPQRQAAQRGIGDQKIHAALDEVKRQRAA